MGQTMTEKILAEHRLSGSLQPGEELAIRIDHTLTQDATGTMAYLQFEALGLDRARNELAVSYVDHNTIQVGFENADDHRYLQSVAARYGVIFSRPGNGICHQLHLERFAQPGKTLLGSDSHTPTCGGMGMFAVGAGGLDVAVAMGRGPFYLTAPRVIRIELSGALRPWCTAKDAILEILRRFSTKGNVGCVFEYGGPGVATLDVPERATIANMGAECGVTTSLFPSDEQTRRFLAAQQREQDWRPLQADADAVYDRVEEIDLAAVEPLAATPHSPGNISRVADLDGLKVDQVLIGSCTNSSYRDLKRVAELLKGRTVHPEVSLGVAPGSRQVVTMLTREGSVTALLDAGARLLENACGFCIGNSMSPGTEAVSLRTSNRNFEGRSGTPSAGIYLVSPETAAVAAVTGRLADPRSAEGWDWPEVRLPERFEVDDALFVRPPDEPGDVTVLRGPNIGDPPANDPLPERLDGNVTIKVGDKITTDHIMPAGARLKYRSNVPRYASFVFEPVDPAFAERAAAVRERGRHNVIVAGWSYGQGSSREHAALCPMYLGVKAVLALSIERIHAANLINFGIVPLLFRDEADYQALQRDDVLTAEGWREALSDGREEIELDVAGRRDLAVRLELTARQRAILLDGGLLNYTRRQAENAEAGR